MPLSGLCTVRRTNRLTSIVHMISERCWETYDRRNIFLWQQSKDLWQLLRMQKLTEYILSFDSINLEINQEFKLIIRNLDAVKRESKEVGPSVFVTVNKGWWRRAGDSSKGKPEIESAVCPSSDKAIKSYAHKPPAWIKLFLPIGTKENLLRKNKPALNGGVVIMEVCISAASRGNVAAETVLLYRKYGIVRKLKVTVPWVEFYWIPIR